MEETQKQLSSAIPHTFSVQGLKFQLNILCLLPFLLPLQRLVALLKSNLSDVFECSNLKAGMFFISQLLAIHKKSFA